MMTKIMAKAYLWLLLILLYSPILIIMIFSFTEAKVLGNWTGFSTKLYTSLFTGGVQRSLVGALWNTFAIAMLACRNWTNQEIADCMGISVNTVKHIISDILSTLHVNSRKELLQFVNK